MAKKNMFYGATISYKDHIEPYYSQGIFEYFVLQSVIPDSTKTDDEFKLVLWAVNNIGAVMNGSNPIELTPNTHPLDGKKKIHFANIYIGKNQLKNLFSDGTFNLGLAPKVYSAETNYVSFDIFNAEKDLLEYTTLDVANPSPPARRIS